MGIDYKKKYMKYKKKYLNLSNRKLDLIIGGMDVEKEDEKWGFSYDDLMGKFQGTNTQKNKFMELLQKTLKRGPRDMDPSSWEEGKGYIRFYTTKKNIKGEWENIEVTLDNTIRRVFGDAIHDLKHKLKQDWYGDWKEAVHPILKKLSDEGNEKMVLATALQDSESTATHSKASIVHNKEDLLLKQGADGFTFGGVGVFEHNLIPHRQKNMGAMFEALPSHDGMQEHLQNKLTRQVSSDPPVSPLSLFGKGGMLVAADHGADAAWLTGKRLGGWVMNSPLVMFDQGVTNLDVDKYKSPIVSREDKGNGKFTDYYTVKNNFEGDDIFAADYCINGERYIYIVQVIGGKGTEKSSEATIIRYMFKCTSAGYESETLGGGVLEGGGNYSKIANNMNYLGKGKMELRLYYEKGQPAGAGEWLKCPLWVSVIAKHHGDFISNIIETIRQDATLLTHDFKNVMLIYAKYRKEVGGKWETPNCGLLIHPNNPANPNNNPKLVAFMKDAADQRGVLDDEGAYIDEDAESYDDEEGDGAMTEEMNYYNFVLTADGNKTWLLSFSPHKDDTTEFEKQKYNRKVLVKKIAQLTEKIKYLYLITGNQNVKTYIKKYLDINKDFKKLERRLYIYLLGLDIKKAKRLRWAAHHVEKEGILRDILRWKPKWGEGVVIDQADVWVEMVITEEMYGSPNQLNPTLQAIFYNLIKDLESKKVEDTFKEKFKEKSGKEVGCELDMQKLYEFCRNILYDSIKDNLDDRLNDYETELRKYSFELYNLEKHGPMEIDRVISRNWEGNFIYNNVEKIMEGEAIGTFSVPDWPFYDKFYEQQGEEKEEVVNYEWDAALDLVAERLRKENYPHFCDPQFPYSPPEPLKEMDPDDVVEMMAMKEDEAASGSVAMEEDDAPLGKYGQKRKRV